MRRRFLIVPILLLLIEPCHLPAMGFFFGGLGGGGGGGGGCQCATPSCPPAVGPSHCGLMPCPAQPICAGSSQLFPPPPPPPNLFAPPLLQPPPPPPPPLPSPFTPLQPSGYATGPSAQQLPSLQLPFGGSNQMQTPAPLFPPLPNLLAPPAYQFPRQAISMPAPSYAVFTRSRPAPAYDPPPSSASDYQPTSKDRYEGIVGARQDWQVGNPIDSNPHPQVNVRMAVEEGGYSTSSSGLQQALPTDYSPRPTSTSKYEYSPTTETFTIRDPTLAPAADPPRRPFSTPTYNNDNNNLDAISPATPERVHPMTTVAPDNELGEHGDDEIDIYDELVPTNGDSASGPVVPSAQQQRFLPIPVGSGKEVARRNASADASMNDNENSLMQRDQSLHHVGAQSPQPASSHGAAAADLLRPTKVVGKLTKPGSAASAAADSTPSSPPDQDVAGLMMDMKEEAFYELKRKGRESDSGLAVPAQLAKCNHNVLQRIMAQKMTSSPAVSKQLIYNEAKSMFGKSIDVVCSRASFSYIVVTSPIYCEHTKRPLTCFAFFQP